ncbi:galactonate dehydratase [Sandaracinobacteroides saxicola]|uniref:Galactonate dehydratase n=1 Tax=Sandaracinobacteroides saxicola TaxID=2759707 RepID=A0A7G5IM27_9SPHN|nr:galactonate dehydratase [Sandaracinobacteroides saxicola]QMW24419.1 galactonate dehydratase [Sandaracinobacteroides saxicola]
MKIRSIKAWAVAGPLSDLCFAKVETDNGLFGWGEGSLPGKCEGVAASVREMAHLIAGMDARRIEHVWQRMVRHSYWKAGPILSSAVSAIDMALWDIRGKYHDAPVHELLGGALRDRIWLYANLGLSSEPEVLRERARGALAVGYTAVKFYPLPPVMSLEGPAAYRTVVACCEAVRDEIGPDGVFCLDFHGRCTPNVAVQMEAAVRHTRPHWIEEPTAPEDVGALQRCQEKFLTPLAVGERYNSRWQFREIFERRLADVVQPDVANCYGISEMHRIAAMAETYGVGYAPHNPNGPVQAQASLHLAAAAQNFSILEHRHDLIDDMAKFASVSPRSTGDGWAAIPEGPGLGIELDETALDAMPIGDRWVAESHRRDGSIGDW